MTGALPFSRRHVLVGLAACAVPWSYSGRAEATLARALTVRQLVQSSARVVRGTAVERFSTWETVGGRRRIVSHTRLLVAADLGRSHDEEEVLVQTWGGRVGDVAQIVHGEAAVQLGEPSLLFLSRQYAGEHRVTAMAQGHFPLEPRGTDLWLRQSPDLPELIDRKSAAVDRLAERSLSEAARLIREALQ